MKSSAKAGDFFCCSNLEQAPGAALVEFPWRVIYPSQRKFTPQADLGRDL